MQALILQGAYDADNASAACNLIHNGVQTQNSDILDKLTVIKERIAEYDGKAFQQPAPEEDSGSGWFPMENEEGARLQIPTPSHLIPLWIFDDLSPTLHISGEVSACLMIRFLHIHAKDARG